MVAAFGIWLFAWFVLGAWQGVLALAPLLAVASGLVLLPAVLLATTRRRRIVAAVACAVLLLPAHAPRRFSSRTRRRCPQTASACSSGTPRTTRGRAVLERLTARQAPDLVVVSQVQQWALEAPPSWERATRTSADSGNPGRRTTSRSCRATRSPRSTRTYGRWRAGPVRALVAQVSLPDGTLSVVAAHPTRPLLVPVAPTGDSRPAAGAARRGRPEP